MSRPYERYFSVWSKSSALVAERAASYVVPFPYDLVTDDLPRTPWQDKLNMLHGVLHDRVHGLAFSPYMQGQTQGDLVTQGQIRQRLQIIRPYTRWIRCFTCQHGNEHTPRIARELGLNTLVGIELTDDRDANEVEMRNGIEVARAGHANIVAVGNEVLLRGDMKEAELLAYIQRFKDAVPGVPVSYVDAYFLFQQHPAVAAACDVLLVNCYPFWESCPVEFGVRYMSEMVRMAREVADGKPVLISETGWPTAGSPVRDAVPSVENALDYFIATMRWARDEQIPVFYFAAFDESWKVAAEGDVGAFWGLWDEDGALKFRQKVSGAG